MDKVDKDGPNWAYHVGSKCTICEVLRDIYHMVDDNAVREKLRVAHDMAKRMSKKLKEYNKKVYRDWWDANPEYEKKLEERMNKGLDYA